MTTISRQQVILGLHHVQITVPQAMEDAALEFYTEVMGLIPIDKPRSCDDRTGTWFQIGGLELHLMTEEGFNRRTTKAHIAYRVDDLAYWRNRMLENEVTPIDTIPIPGFQRFEARDPFGNRIEFIQRIG